MLWQLTSGLNPHIPCSTREGKRCHPAPHVIASGLSAKQSCTDMANQMGTASCASTDLEHDLSSLEGYLHSSLLCNLRIARSVRAWICCRCFNLACAENSITSMLMCGCPGDEAAGSWRQLARGSPAFLNSPVREIVNQGIARGYEITQGIARGQERAMLQLARPPGTSSDAPPHEMPDMVNNSLIRQGMLPDTRIPEAHVIETQLKPTCRFVDLLIGAWQV